MADRRPWPYGGQAASPPALTQSPDGLLNSARSLAGNLRLGTAPGAGPRGVRNDGPSDLGMDRVSPRFMDPIGTDTTRTPGPSSTLVTRQR